MRITLGLGKSDEKEIREKGELGILKYAYFTNFYKRLVYEPLGRIKK